MGGWELMLGIYPGILIGFCTDKFEDGFRHSIYLPFIFLELNTYYD